MAERMCVKRLQSEFRSLCKDPVPHIVARPSPNDICDWHYVLEGFEGTPYEGGYYYGKIEFPSDYPFQPPGISITTPNGRFMTQTKICLSMTDYHPESWNPMWHTSTILTGLLSFMADDSSTTGSITTSVEEKQRLAKASLAFNCENPTFKEVFPDYVEKFKQLAEQRSNTPASPQQDISPANSEGSDNNKRKGPGNAGVQGRRKKLRQSIRTWMMFCAFRSKTNEDIDTSNPLV